eukprot:scpid14287/ scgid5585/ Down syndrome cell adhesion molecule-like protein Dscam2
MLLSTSVPFHRRTVTTLAAILLACCCINPQPCHATKNEVRQIKITTSVGPSPLYPTPDLPWNVVQRGQQVNVTCTDATAPPAQPITLQQNHIALTKRLQSVRGAMTTIHKHGVTQITISSFDEENEGDYSCLYQTFTKEVTSQSIPLLMARGPSVTVPAITRTSISQPVELVCSATGVPPPRVQIVVLTTGRTLANQSQAVTGDLQHGRQATVATWREEYATLSADGQYACLATNAVGQQRQEANITVQYPAIVQSLQRSPVEHPVSGLDTLVLSCTAQGNPLPSVSWSLNQTDYPAFHSAAAAVGNAALRENASVETSVASDDHMITSTLTIRTPLLSNSGVYRCRASNVAGGGERYQSIVVIVPPTPPRDLTIARTGLTAVTLSWNAPSWYGNAEHVLYEVSIYVHSDMLQQPVGQDTGERGSLYRVDNRSNIHFKPGSSGFVSVISNLDVNTRYGFLVRSRNRAGPSPDSDYIQTQTLPDAPPAPVNITINDIMFTSFNVTWHIPAVLQSQGKSSEIQFVVRMRQRPRSGEEGHMFTEVCKTEDFGCEVSGLRKGMTYQIVMQAFNRGGMGAPSSIIPVVTKTTVTSSPIWRGARVTGLGSVRLMWQMPEDTGGSEILYWNFAYQLIDDNANTTATQQTKIEAGMLFFPVVGLKETETYQFDLSATNRAGESLSSALFFTMPHRDDPSQPESAVVQQTTRQSILLTVADRDTLVSSTKEKVAMGKIPGDITILANDIMPSTQEQESYIIRYKPSFSDSWKSIEVVDKYSPVCLNHLHADTSYVIQTALQKDGDMSIYSIPVTAHTDHEDAVPAPVVEALTHSSIEVAWPMCGPHWEPFSIQLHEVVFRDVVGGAMPSASIRDWHNARRIQTTNQPVVIDNLRPSSVYQVRLVVHYPQTVRYSKNVTVAMPAERPRDDTSGGRGKDGTYSVSSKMSVGIISFAGGGGLLLALVLVVGLLLWRRYRLRRDSINKAFVNVPGDTATPGWTSDHLMVTNQTSYNPHSARTPMDEVLNNELALTGSRTPSFVVASYRPSISNSFDGRLETDTPHTTPAAAAALPAS